MKFPPILHRAALFCLFGLIVIAVIGGAIHWVGFKEWLRSWQELIGASIAALVTAAAVWFTARETRKIFNEQITIEADRAKRSKTEELIRALNLVHHALEDDITDLEGIEYQVRKSLEEDNETDRFLNFRRAITFWTNPNRERIGRLVEKLGDVEAQVSRMLISYNNNGQNILSIFHEVLRIPLDMKLEDGFTLETAELDLKMIRLQRYVARTCQMLIEDYVAHHQLGSISTWRTVHFTDAQEKRREAAREPVDMKNRPPSLM